MNYCTNCIYYRKKKNGCDHESARDLVTGLPGDAAMQRYNDSDEDAQEVCGKEGKFWVQSPPKQRRVK